MCGSTNGMQGLRLRLGSELELRTARELLNYDSLISGTVLAVVTSADPHIHFLLMATSAATTSKLGMMTLI